MPALFIFLFKVNIALVLFCLGYYVVLRHLTFYTLNRIYLVIAILFSTLYPNINLTNFALRHQQLTEPVQTVILNWKAPAENFVKPLYQPNYWQWVEIIFWAGVLLFAVRMLMQLLSLYRLYRQSRPGQIDEHTVRLLKDDIGPFSFWRSIYINPTKLSPSELKNVLEHEQVHVSQWHTLDLLLAELSTIFYWFNPGVWLMKKAVRENIEFITDRKILQKGTDSREYQYSLVSVSLATMPNTIVNHFNISTIKKRIIMMNAKRSSGYKLTRYLFLVPAVVALLLVFSLSKAEISKNSIHTIKSIATAITSVAIVDNNKPNTAIHIKTAKPVLAKKIKATADTVYAGKSKNGKKSILLTSNKSMDSIGYVINGVRSSRADLSAIDPGRIYSVDMISAKHAKEFISDVSDKSDFLFVTTDDSEAGKKIKEKIDKSFKSGTIAKAYNLSFDSKNTSSDIAPTATGSGSSSTTMSYSISKSSDEAPVAIEGSGSNNVSAVTIVGVDPKVKAKTVVLSKKNLTINTEPKVAVTIRGSGDNDAPQVYTEDINEVRPSGDKVKKIYLNKLKINDELTIDGPGEKLFIVDGKEVKSLKGISAEDIKSLTVLKDGTAETKYGEKGKNGVIEIITKKGK